MNPARIALNILLTVALAAGGVALLATDRWTWGTGSDVFVFTGTSLWLLGVSALLLAGFTAAITSAWLRGDAEMPPSDEVVPHPAYRGRLMLRFWYLIGPALACFAAALWMAA